MRNLIREGKTFQLPSIIETNTNLGMQTLGQALQKLVQDGLVTPESALAKGLDPAILSGLRLGTPTLMPGTPASSNAYASAGAAPPKPMDDVDLADLKPLGSPFSFKR